MKGFTLIELIVVIALVAVMATALVGWFVKVKDTVQVDRNGDGLIYYDDLTLPEPPDYRKILSDYGIDVSDLTEEELQELVEELKGGGSP